MPETRPPTPPPLLELKDIELGQFHYRAVPKNITRASVRHTGTSAHLLVILSEQAQISR